MEFFAAREELGRLKEGHRPRHFPTDGFRRFLTLQMAKEWVNNGQSPFPATAWDGSRGDAAIEAQLSMLAAASHLIPAGRVASLSNVYNARCSNDESWERTRFTNMRWDCVSGTLSYKDCGFAHTTVAVRSDAVVGFEDCRFEDVSVTWESFPRKLSDAMLRGLDAQAAALEVTNGSWDLAELCEKGVHLKVGNLEWKLQRSQLELFAEAIRRLRRKTMKANFSKGTHRSELMGILPLLKKLGIVHEDTSRGCGPHGARNYAAFRPVVVLNTL